MNTAIKHKIDITPFLSTDALRPVMNGIIYDGEYGNATNGHICIRWKDDNPEITPKAPNVKAIYSGFKNADALPFKIDDYLVWESSIELINDFNDCETCNGECTVEWVFEHYEKYDECPECKGTGRQKTDKMIPNPDSTYDLNGSYFSQVNMNKVCDFLKQLGLNECTILRTEKLQAHIINQDGYELLIMPCSKKV